MDVDPSEVWKDSEEKKDMEKEIQNTEDIDEDKLQTFESEYPLSWPRQFVLLFDRSLYAYRRNPQQNVLTLVRAIIVAVVIATAYWNMQYNQSGAQLRPGAIFFIALTSNFSAFIGIIGIFFTRPVYYRERFAGMYHSTAFSLAKFLSDIPALALESFLLLIICYFIINLQSDAGRFFFFYFVLLGLYLATSQFAQLFAIYLENIENAGLIFVTLIVSNALASGFLLPRDQIPPWWIWLYWADYQQYGLQALILVQLENVDFHCDAGEATPINVPNGDGTNRIEYYCPIESGRDVINQFAVPGIKWGSLFIVYGFWAIFVLFGVIGLKFVNHQKK